MEAVDELQGNRRRVLEIIFWTPYREVGSIKYYAPRTNRTSDGLSISHVLLSFRIECGY